MFGFKKIYFFILFLGITNNIFATNIKRVDFFKPNQETPSALLVDNLSKPKEFHRSNNLTRPSGSFKVANGDPLYIKGNIFDAFGIPLSNVIVKIWQTNAIGVYHSLISKNSASRDPNFLMSGQSVTNNLGEYEFITIFPGSYDDRTPHINFLIIHKKFGIIETEMYFKNHPKNIFDPIYLNYPKKSIAALTADIEYVNTKNINEGKIATFNIVMDGIHQYKKY